MADRAAGRVARDPIDLRPATAADLPFLLELRRLTMSEHLLRVGEPTDEAAHAARVQAHFDDAQVILQGGERIGLLKLNRGGATWHLHQIQILPAHQGRGIGAAVIGEVLAQAAARQVAVQLSVLHGNPARGLYERLGFRVVGATAIETVMRRGHDA